MRLSIKPKVSDTYERPNQTWICGLAEEGAPCPVGPTTGGYCSHAVACHPRREGDRFICNRSSQRGGPCEAGPTPEGECCQQYSCTPTRSLRSRRTRFIWALSLATLGSLCMVLSSNWRNEFLAPGPLTVHHAQLVAHEGDQTNRCANCHVSGNQSLGEWISHVTNPAFATPTQSDLCLECHKKEISVEFALAAHNVDPGVLLVGDRVTSENRHIDPHGSFDCSTCHREHHGAAYDLKSMTNSACQACHQEQYHSFATNHPELTGWPARRRTRIAFDHALHQTKHFPAEKQEFDCNSCHQATADGSFQTTLGYDAACAKCHDGDLETSWKTGVPFVSLPLIDAEALREAGHDIGPWPEGATGDFDGALPLITKFLLLSDEKARNSLEVLGADFDFYDVNPDNPEQLAAAAAAILAFKDLIKELAGEGYVAIESRLEKTLGRKPGPHELADSIAHLSAEDLSALGNRWSSKKGTGPISPPFPTEVDESSKLDLSPFSGGGWNRDDESFVLRYRPGGHDDPWLAAWISLISQATAGPQARTAESLLGQIMKPTAPGKCGTCHSVNRTASGALEVQWRAKRPSTARSFTMFSHAPHVLQSHLADCTACHRINESAQVMENYEAETEEFVAGFHALTKQDCAICHKPGAAGDSCTQCHRYHIQ